MGVGVGVGNIVGFSLFLYRGGYRGIAVPVYRVRVAKVHGYRGTDVQCTNVQRYRGTWVSGYRDTESQKHMVQRYRVTEV